MRRRITRTPRGHEVWPSGWLLVALVAMVAGVACAATNDTRVILLEDFESYTNTASLRAVWREGTSELESEVPGGGQAASHDGGDLNSRGGFSVQPDESHNVLFSADVYDFATNADKRVTVALRNGSGANLEFGHIYEVGPYATRIVGFADPAEWISFDPGLEPHRGWNRFQAVISLTNTVVTIDLGADGKIDRVLTFAGPSPTKSFTAIRFGGLPNRKSHGGPALIDNIKLALVPAEESLPTAVVGSQEASSAIGDSQRAGRVSLNARTAVPVASVPSQTERGVEPRVYTPLWWIVGALAVIIALLCGLLIVLRRGSHVASSTVATIPSGIPDVIRGRIPPELTEFAKQSLVQGLYTHRNTLIEVQKRAHQEIIELEARLAALELPLSERIRAYEKRIAELEKELDSRGEEMRELTQATLLLIREKLEKEKERERDDDRNRFN